MSISTKLCRSHLAVWRWLIRIPFNRKARGRSWTIMTSVAKSLPQKISRTTLKSLHFSQVAKYEKKVNTGKFAKGIYICVYIYIYIYIYTYSVAN